MSVNCVQIEGEIQKNTKQKKFIHLDIIIIVFYNFTIILVLVFYIDGLKHN